MGHALRFTEEGLAALLKRRDTSASAPAGVDGGVPARQGSIPTSPSGKTVESARHAGIGIVGKWLDLPLPPTNNNLYATVKRKGKDKRVLSRAGRSFKRNVVQIVKIIGQIRPIEGRVRITAVVHPQRNGTFDIANREKALCDAFTKAGVWRDDCQIDALRLHRGVVVRPAGRLRVLVEEIADQPIGASEVP